MENYMGELYYKNIQNRRTTRMWLGLGMKEGFF